MLKGRVATRIQIQTTNPLLPSLDGVLYTACALTSLLALSTGSTSSPAFHVIPISSISSFTVLGLPAGSQHPQSPTPVSTTLLLDRANSTLARAKTRAAKINKHVDRATQDLFDALDKQFAARWRGKDIIVMERVVVKAPNHRSEDCRVTKDGEGLLDRVRKVVSFTPKFA